MKLERARAIARGETVPEQTGDDQADRVKPNVRSIKMNTQRSTNREEPILEEEQIEEAVSSTGGINEQATVEATQPLSPQFAALAKEKRAAQLLKAEAQKLMEQAKSMQAGAADSIPLSRLKSETLKVLQEQGALTPEFYNAMTEHLMGNQGGINPEIQALKEEIAALKKGVDETFITKEGQAEEAALTEMLYEAENLAKEGGSHVERGRGDRLAAESRERPDEDRWRRTERDRQIADVGLVDQIAAEDVGVILRHQALTLSIARSTTFCISSPFMFASCSSRIDFHIGMRLSLRRNGSKATRHS
jgi:hypothetical protein